MCPNFPLKHSATSTFKRRTEQKRTQFQFPGLWKSVESNIKKKHFEEYAESMDSCPNYKAWQTLWRGFRSRGIRSLPGVSLGVGDLAGTACRAENPPAGGSLGRVQGRDEEW